MSLEDKGWKIRPANGYGPRKMLLHQAWSIPTYKPLVEGLYHIDKCQIKSLENLIILLMLLEVGGRRNPAYE
jgi:hypothetical protein